MSGSRRNPIGPRIGRPAGASVSRAGQWSGIFIFSLLAAACAGTDRTVEAEPLLILAAASLESVLPPLLDSFERTTGSRPRRVLGATGSLAAQIRSGAPADVFLTADGETMNRLAPLGLIDPESRLDFASGLLALVVREGVALPSNVGEVVDERFEVIALATPEHAPYGAAAVDVLKGVDAWDAVEERLIYGENVAQALHFVLSGNADAALVALSLVLQGRDFSHLPVEPSLHDPIRHEAAVLADSRHPDAKNFVAFLRSEEAKRILREYGFAGASHR